MHVYSSYPLGLAECYSRWHSYPPPYWYNGGWYYATPWLWIDGDKRGSYSYSLWTTKITSRMAVESPFTVTMWGDWFPAAGTGTVYAQFRNDSTEALTGYVLFVVTEDSIYSPSYNGDMWHNHVVRDFIPNYIGDIVTIPAGDSLVVSQPFALGASWNPEKIRFVTFIQDTVLQPDTVKEIWQGAMLDIAQLGIVEYTGTGVAATNITAAPNPCVNSTRFAFTLESGERYQISIFDVSGRRVRTLDGRANGSAETVEWDLRNEAGNRVSSGVYLYRFASEASSTTGKLVVR